MTHHSRCVNKPLKKRGEPLQEIKPFRGLRFNIEKVSIDEVVAPPYDVITGKARKVLFERSPYNVVRLILPHGVMGDDKYAQANIYFDKWKRDGVLVRDKNPSFYFLEERFSYQGTEKTRLGFIGLLRLKELGDGVYPHEDTIRKVKKDRLRLLETCRANFSQVFMLYSDPDFVFESLFDRVRGNQPNLYLRDDEGVERRLWVVDDPVIIQEMENFIKDKNLVIADGHHRYETALEFKKIAESLDGNPASPHNFIMAYFTNASSGGAVSFPTHRVIGGIDRENYQSMVKSLKKNFVVHELPFSGGDEYKVEKEFLKKLRMEGHKNPSIGIVSSFEKRFYIVVLNPAKVKSLISKEGEKDHIVMLDTVILSKLVMPKYLGISPEELKKMENVRCLSNTYRAVDLVLSGKYQVGFILNPLPLENVMEVASKGYLLPQKSTYFYPKLLTGLVMRDFEG